MTANRIKKAALPEEHGSWGFALEPLLLALLVAYSTSALLLALSAFFVFLSYQPVKLLLNPKYNAALKKSAKLVLSIYSFIALILFAFAFEEAKFHAYIPFAIAFVFMVLYLLSVKYVEKRPVIIGLLAPAGFDLIATSILLFQGWTTISATGFYFVLLSRVLLTVHFIHERLQITKGLSPNRTKVFLIGVSTILILLALACSTIIPELSLLSALILFLRSIIGLTPKMGKLNVVTVGILEFIYGGLFVLINYLAYNNWVN